MIKRGDKTGQFYLIAAIIISALIMGAASVSNYLVKTPDLRFNDIKEEIQTESSYVMDYALNNTLSQTEFNTLLLNFTKTSSNYLGNDKNIYFIFGDENNLTVSGYQGQDKEVVLVSGLSSLIITEEAGEFTGSIVPSENKITLEIDEYPYDFNITSGKVFYFIISKDIKNEEYIISG